MGKKTKNQKTMTSKTTQNKINKWVKDSNKNAPGAGKAVGGEMPESASTAVGSKASKGKQTFRITLPPEEAKWPSTCLCHRTEETKDKTAATNYEHQFP